MQYGRLIGGGLAALGALLLFLEFSFFIAGTTRGAGPEGAGQAAQVAHHVPALPGILGAALVIAGLIVFFTARLEDEPDPGHAVK
jgi:hypothetical protein